jgi:hypothetical protein
MALVTLHPMFTAFSGRLGDKVFKTYRDKIVVTRVPRFDGYVPSAAQRDRRARMREATAYTQRVYADPAAKAFYVAIAKKLGRQLFRLAVSDFLKDHRRMREIAAIPASRNHGAAQPQPNKPNGFYRRETESRPRPNAASVSGCPRLGSCAEKFRFE